MPPRIKLVLFDAFDTLLTPRHSIGVQYSQVFSPYFQLSPESIQPVFKKAIREVQKELPAYTRSTTDPGSFQRPSDAWWGEVIRRTAVGAGVDPKVVEDSLSKIVPAMVHRFSSREGYRLFDNSLPTLRALKDRGIKTGVVSNTDSTMRLVLDDLEVSPLLSLVVLSAEEGVEKPDTKIWQRALEKVNELNSERTEGSEVSKEEIVHIGDELKADYWGAKSAGIRALWLRRPAHDLRDADESGANKVEDSEKITVLSEVLEYVDRFNGDSY